MVHVASSLKDVILSAGALDTPKLLLLNGIGPAAELKPLGIDVVHDLPGVGKDLRDHILAFVCAEVDTSLTERGAFESNADGIRDAQLLWNQSQTGPFAHHNSTLFGGFLRDPHLEEYEEFQSLPKDVQQFLSKPTVPAWEFAGCAALFPPGHQLSPDSDYMSMVTFLMNPQSVGEVTLSSANPQDAPVLDFNYFEHPFDKKLMAEAVRTTVKFFEESDIKKHFKKFIFAPASGSDEDMEVCAGFDLTCALLTGSIDVPEEFHQHGLAREWHSKDGKSHRPDGLRRYQLPGLRSRRSSSR
jgi:choline dehydrogenase-like flavoprotein